jgi:hypothetical protein
MTSTSFITRNIGSGKLGWKSGEKEKVERRKLKGEIRIAESSREKGERRN